MKTFGLVDFWPEAAAAKTTMRASAAMKTAATMAAAAPGLSLLSQKRQAHQQCHHEPEHHS
jgi:hypothetical protein